MISLTLERRIFLTFLKKNTDKAIFFIHNQFRIVKQLFRNMLGKLIKPAKNKWLRRLQKTFIVLLAGFLLFLLLDLIFPVKTDISFTPIVKSADGVVLYASLTKDQQWRMFTPLKEITPELAKAIVFKEDKYFYWHWGINPIAVSRAFLNNISKGRRTSGASTITMQVARMLEPKKRSYGNKFLEMFRALQLELHYSKSELLQLYLNLVPYGSNIQGVKAASLLYFNKMPDQLSIAEITALSIIPNRPNSLVMGRDNLKITAERNKWLQRFRHAKLFSAQSITDAENEPLNAARTTGPKSAPQFAIRMRRQYPGIMEIQTTINATIQNKTEELTTNYSRALKLNNISNASVIVIDNATRHVVSYVGSPDFFDKQNAGQVDGVRAIRSPGSTLKPLVYGLGFDKGFGTPKTVVTDVPVDFSGYTPENYDLNFNGAVTIEESLKQSLNIPAVKALSQLGMPFFINTMRSAGFNSVWANKEKLGLSTILGGCGVKLEELAGLYCSFANGGKYKPLVWLKERSNIADSSVQLLSEESAYMLTQILKELKRPDLPNGNIAANAIPKIAWKTGTSYGRRDAWSIGYNKRYTIGVWIGNFSGKGSPELNGAQTATPLLFQLFKAIDNNAMADLSEAPKNLQMRFVCSMSGKPPTEHCKEQIMDYFIPGLSDNTPCKHLKEVYLSADEKYTYCTTCQLASGYKTKLVLNIEPDLAFYYDQHHIPYEKIPEHNPSCSRSFVGSNPRINSLTNDGTYIITDKGKQQMQLSCSAANDVTTVYWYINDKFLGSASKADKLVFIPDTPVVKISCTDDKGRTTNIKISIKFI